MALNNWALKIDPQKENMYTGSHTFRDQKISVVITANSVGLLLLTIRSEDGAFLPRYSGVLKVLDARREVKDTQTLNLLPHEGGLVLEATVPVLVKALDAKRGYTDDKGLVTLILNLQLSEPKPAPVTQEPVPFVGLANQGATCYMNSLLQSLYHIPHFRSLIYRLDPTKFDKSDEQNVCLNLQRLFGMMQLYGKVCSTRQLTKSFGWGEGDAFMQHDVQEFSRVLLDNLETKMKRTPLEGSMATLFSGRTSRYVRCTNIDYETRHEEVFYDLSLVVSEEASYLERSFEKYVEQERLEGNNQYEVEGHGKQDAVIGVDFVRLPLILHLHLQRFQYDYTYNRMVKINSLFEFPNEIDLERFMMPGQAATVPHVYELFGVLVHMGGAMDGHYFAYLRAGPKLNWYLFNDSQVKQVSEKEATERNFGGPDPDRPDGPDRSYSAYMLVYVAKHAIPELFREIGDDEVPEAVVEYVERLKEKDAKREIEEREKALTRTAYLISQKNVEDLVRYGQLRACRSGCNEISFSFKTYDSVKTVYEKAAAALGLNSSLFYLFVCTSTLHKFINPDLDTDLAELVQLTCDRPVTFFVYERSNLELSHRLFPDYPKIESLENLSVVFAIAYMYELSHPLQLSFVVPLPDVSVYADIVQAFRIHHELDNFIEFNVYFGKGSDFELCDQDIEADQIPLGSFLIFEPTEPIFWPHMPEDESDSSEEQEDSETGDPKVAYKGSNPLNAIEFLRDKQDVRKVQLRSTHFNGTLEFPESLKIDDFRKFVGRQFDRNFDCRTASVLFYPGFSKEPLCVARDDRVWDRLGQLRDSSGTCRLTAWYLEDIDETIVDDGCQIILEVHDSLQNWFLQKKTPNTFNFIVPTSTTIGSVLKKLGHWSTERFRMLRLSGDQVDGIYNSDTTVGESSVWNPAHVEPTPADQLELFESDKLVRILHIRQAYHQTSAQMMRWTYFKVVPLEPFSESQKRHRAMLSKPPCELGLMYWLMDRSGRDIRLLKDDDILYNIIEEDPSVGIRVIIPLDPSLYDIEAQRSHVKLFN